MDSSKVSEIWTLQKPKIINKTTKSWDKNIIKDLEEVSLKQYRDFLSWLLSPKTILPQLTLFYGSVFCLVRSIAQYWISKKRLNRFKRLIFVDSDNTFHITDFTTLKATLSSYQLALLCDMHNEAWSSVWMGNSSKCKFLPQRDLELWDSHGLPNFPTLHPINCQESWIFCCFCNVFTIYSSLMEPLLTRTLRCWDWETSKMLW